jgi:hypothetical protein
MRFGKTACLERSRNFAWYPGWAYILLFFGILPFAVVVLFTTRYLTVSVPLCGRHRNHWFWRNLAIYGTLALGSVLFGGLLLAIPDRRFGKVIDRVHALLVLAVFLGPFIYLVVAAVVKYSAIRATEITDRSITLVNVSPTFARALEDQAAADWEEKDWDDRPARRQRGQHSNQYFDPKPSPGEHPPTDGGDEAD